MKKLALLLPLALAGCSTTASPCYNVQTNNDMWQGGIVVEFGAPTQRSHLGDYRCPNTIASDLADPPLPFPGENG